MKAETQGCLGALGSCGFAVWGAWLNAAVTTWMWSLHYDMRHTSFSPPMVQLLLGFFLGFVTACAFFTRNPQTAKRGGFVLLGIITALVITETWLGARLIMGFDEYGFSFLWALSLIAIGYILRSRPKNCIR